MIVVLALAVVVVVAQAVAVFLVVVFAQVELFAAVVEVRFCYFVGTDLILAVLAREVKIAGTVHFVEYDSSAAVAVVDCCVAL